MNEPVVASDRHEELARSLDVGPIVCRNCNHYSRDPAH